MGHQRKLKKLLAKAVNGPTKHVEIIKDKEGKVIGTVKRSLLKFAKIMKK